MQKLLAAVDFSKITDAILDQAARFLDTPHDNSARMVGR